MDHHDIWRERLALELYGEVDANESAQIEAHVASCGACRELREQLRAGLGRTSRGAAAGGALEHDLCRIMSRAAASVVSERPAAFTRPFAIGLGAGLAAGVLAMLSLGGPTAAPEREAATSQETFARATPPPLARSGGELAQLASYLRR